MEKPSCNVPFTSSGGSWPRFSSWRPHMLLKAPMLSCHSGICGDSIPPILGFARVHLVLASRVLLLSRARMIVFINPLMVFIGQWSTVGIICNIMSVMLLTVIVDVVFMAASLPPHFAHKAIRFLMLPAIFAIPVPRLRRLRHHRPSRSRAIHPQREAVVYLLSKISRKKTWAAVAGLAFGLRKWGPTPSMRRMVMSSRVKLIGLGQGVSHCGCAVITTASPRSRGALVQAG